jgi:hypothetical protein
MEYKTDRMSMAKCIITSFKDQVDIRQPASDAQYLVSGVT